MGNSKPGKLSPQLPPLHLMNQFEYQEIQELQGATAKFLQEGNAMVILRCNNGNDNPWHYGHSHLWQPKRPLQPPNSLGGHI